MKKLVYGVGVNDLGYRVNVYEYVTKNGGKKSGNLFSMHILFIVETHARKVL